MYIWNIDDQSAKECGGLSFQMRSEIPRIQKSLQKYLGKSKGGGTDSTTDGKLGMYGLQEVENPRQAKCRFIFLSLWCWNQIWLHAAIGVATDDIPTSCQPCDPDTVRLVRADGQVWEGNLFSCVQLRSKTSHSSSSHSDKSLWRGAQSLALQFQDFEDFDVLIFVEPQALLGRSDRVA